MAPKVLTKKKIKEILAFQCEEYASLIEQYKELQIDAIDIMIIDHTYEEFGYDKEAIRGAMNKHKDSLDNDRSFEDYMNKIGEYKKNTFLNI